MHNIVYYNVNIQHYIWMLEFGLCIHVGVHMVANHEMAKGAIDLQNLAFDDVLWNMVKTEHINERLII